MFICDFLSDRYFKACVENIYSAPYSQEADVPQGSNLSVTLFSHKINSIVFCLLPDVKCSSLCRLFSYWFQRLPPARGGTAQSKIFHLANRCQLIHPGPSSSRSSFFMESSQLYTVTPTHYSTEPLTTGPNYDPLLLLLALIGDVHPNPGLSRYPCSVCFKNVTSQGTSYLCTRCSHWVHSKCSGLRNAADYRKANGWVCTACMTPPWPRAPTSPPSPTHTPTMSDKSFNILQWNANGIGNKQTERQWYRQQTDGTKHLPRGAQRQSGGHSGVQAHG